MHPVLTTTTPELGRSARDRPWWRSFIRPKGHLGATAKATLLIIVCVPLVMMLARVVAYPHVGTPDLIGFNALHALGVMLNNHWSLAWVPPADRPKAVYLLMLPTAAFIITMARLTFGLRVLGLRSILIAIGFQKIGVIPSLTVMTVVIFVIMAIRPAMRRIRLPLFARIGVVLCVSSIVMVGALLAGPRLHSEIVWSVAFFPVIIMAMIAEGVAKTIADDNALMAIWRLSWTMIVAGVIATIGQTGPMADFMLRFPEFMLIQIIAIIVTSEYFDLRLMENTPAKLERVLNDKDWSRWNEPPQRKVAVVHNRWNTNTIGRIEEATPQLERKHSLQPLVDALRDQGAKVRVFDGDMTLFKELQKFLPPEPGTDTPGGIVFNMATGIQGIAMETHVPAMLELAGVAYTGPDPVALSNLLDRGALLTTLRRVGIDVPNFLQLGDEGVDRLQFPLRIHAPPQLKAPSIRIRNVGGLNEWLAKCPPQLCDKMTVEEIPAGRDIRASLMGNGWAQCLPLLERFPRGRKRVCPAGLDEELAERIRESAIAAFTAAGCRDYARIDFRIDLDDKVVLVAINVQGVLARRGSFADAAKAAGLNYSALINHLHAVAWERYSKLSHY